MCHEWRREQRARQDEELREVREDFERRPPAPDLRDEPPEVVRLATEEQDPVLVER